MTIQNVHNAELAIVYYKFLKSIDWYDPILIAGIREGLNKFLSNAFLAVAPGKNKYHKTQFVSDSALQKLNYNLISGLIFEHIVPKNKLIQSVCEEKAKSGALTIEFIENLLNNYWILATITKDEDKKLSRTAMPRDWDGKDVFARYKAAGIILLPNPFFGKQTVA